MNKTKNISLSLSIFLSLITAALILFCCFFLPSYINWKCTNTLSMFTGELPTTIEKVAIYLGGYLLLALAATADGVLIRLLLLIKKGQVFTAKTVSSLKCISFLIMAVGALFVLLTPYFRMACAVGFLTFFVGVVILVVKNVMEDAVRIKAENDFTI